jgi:hypothetical protein
MISHGYIHMIYCFATGKFSLDLLVVDFLVVSSYNMRFDRPCRVYGHPQHTFPQSMIHVSV